MKIAFNYLCIKKRFTHSEEARKLIHFIIGEEKRKLGAINIIFTNNSYILSINRKYLKHSYCTDVITFSNNLKSTISGDIFISIDQVVINAQKFGAPKLEELFRVMIHGILHLIGYVDEREDDRRIIRMKEDFYLSKIMESNTIGSDELIL